MQEFPFLHSARCLMLIDICMKFPEVSLRGFQVTERTRFVTEGQTDGRPGKNNMSPNPEGGRHKYYSTSLTNEKVMKLLSLGSYQTGLDSNAWDSKLSHFISFNKLFTWEQIIIKVKNTFFLQIFSLRPSSKIIL